MDKNQHSQDAPTTFKVAPVSSPEVATPTPGGQVTNSGTPAPQGAMKVFLQEDFYYSGPLPDPQTLQGYEQIVPGAAQSIIDMARLEQAHRHKIEDRNNESMIQDMVAERDERKRGQYMAFCFAVVATVIGGWLIAVGQTLAGSVFAGSCILGIVSSFLKNNSKKDDEAPTEQQKALGDSATAPAKPTPPDQHHE